MTSGRLPDELVQSADGTAIALFRSGDGPPVVLVHGAGADHTTWRVVAPLLAARLTVAAIDRRGRGASGDGPAYAIEREFEDVAAVADRLADAVGAPVPVVGHSFGGRVALGASLLTGSVGRVVSYEGAPPPDDGPDGAPDLLTRLEEDRLAGRYEQLLETFLREVVGLSDADLAAYRANPVWPDRVAAAGTIVRELAGGSSPAAGLRALSRVGVPVLQVLGSDSPPAFAAGVRALDARLPHGRVEVLAGARHAAHHTHADAFARLVTAFVASP